MPTLPDLHAFVVMGLTCAALYLFSREHIRAEATSLWVLLTLALLVAAGIPAEKISAALNARGRGL